MKLQPSVYENVERCKQASERPAILPREKATEGKIGRSTRTKSGCNDEQKSFRRENYQK